MRKEGSECGRVYASDCLKWKVCMILEFYEERVVLGMWTLLARVRGVGWRGAGSSPFVVKSRKVCV